MTELGFFEQLAQFIRLRHYEESYYALVAAYMDESADPSKAGVYSGVFVVGGILGRGVQLFELDRKWEKLRKRSDININYYKASECELAKKEFRKFVVDPKNQTEKEKQHLESISCEFISLIPYERDLLVHGIGVLQSDFYEVIKDANAKAILGDSPYRLTYDLAMVQCAWAMQQLEKSIKRKKRKTMDASPSRDYVSFVCDEDEEHSLLANEAYRNLKEHNPKAAKYMATFSSANDKSCEVLQAADAVAYEIRRVLHFALKHKPGDTKRKQFGILADAGKVFLIQYATKEQLLHIVATHKPGEPFKLDQIMKQVFHANVKF